MKKKNLLGLLVFTTGLALVTACGIGQDPEPAYNEDIQDYYVENAEPEETLNDSNDYNENTRLIYIGNAELEAILNDTSGQGTFVYIGSPTCPICNQFRPVVETVLGNLDAQLLYFETDSAAADDIDLVRELFERMGVFGTPTIVYLENGVVLELVNSLGEEELQSLFEQHDGLR